MEPVVQAVTALLGYGPLGIFCYLLWIQLSKKDNHIEEQNKRVQQLLENHARAIDEIRKAQTEREKEVSQLLQSYGASVVTAVDQTHDLAERLWSPQRFGGVAPSSTSLLETKT